MAGTAGSTSIHAGGHDIGAGFGGHLGHDLWIEWVRFDALREQDVNAHVMPPAMFQRLVDNIKKRGQLESMPYCAQPNGEGPIEVVSGHHRVRAALAAGLEGGVVIIDRSALTRSQITAKQLAHNAIVGSDDPELVKRLVAQITSVDDLLETGLSEEFLPTPDRFEVTLFTPVADYRWKSCTFLFLSHQADDLEAMVKSIKGQVEVVCLTCEQQFEPFMRAVAAFAQEKKILSAHTAVAMLIKTAKDALPPPPDTVDHEHAAAPEVQE